MSDDRIAEILARHEQVPSGNLSIEAISLAHADRATLLAEVERLRGHVALVAERARQLSEERDYAWGEVEKQRAQIERLRAELDVELLRLAACNVVAMADTPESAIEARKMKPEYRSAALIRVERRVDEVIALRAENERLRANLRECACACSSIRECESEWAKDNYCLHLNARHALEGKP